MTLRPMVGVARAVARRQVGHEAGMVWVLEEVIVLQQGEPGLA
jgi:hypothetical protein